MGEYIHVKTVTQPKGLRINLFQHQLASIYNMEQLEIEKKIIKDDVIIETKIGINADETGYGKTVSMIGLIVRDKMEWDVTTPYVSETISSESGGKIVKRCLKRFVRLSSTLVLASQSIIGQWCNELSNTDLKVGKVLTNKIVDDINPEDYDVILVSPSIYNKFIMTNSNFAWKRFIFDEPGHLRVSGMKSIEAGFYWFVTATPNSIMYQHRNCRGSFMKEIIGYGWWDFETQFSDMILRNDSQFVRSSFDMPQTYHHYYECFEPISNIVNDFVSPNISTMVSAGNIEGAIMALGGNKTSNIIELVKNKKLEELEEIESKIRIYTIRNDENRLREWLSRKDRIKEQINELENRFNAILEGNCNICLDSIKSPVLEPNCQNVFCGQCLITWMQTNLSCPMCRSCVSPQELIYVSNNEKSKPQLQKQRNLTKLEKTIEIIMNDPNKKLIIFSAYDNTFFPITSALKENNIKYAEIKGAISSREKNLDGFKNGNIPVIFLNSTFNGAGINIQEATDIILYHEMSANTQNQILGRANRIGRIFPLHVHHLQVQT